MALLKQLPWPFFFFFFFLCSCLTIESWGLKAPPSSNGIIIDEDYDSFPNDTYIDRRAFPDDFKFGALTWAFKVYIYMCVSKFIILHFVYIACILMDFITCDSNLVKLTPHN